MGEKRLGPLYRSGLEFVIVPAPATVAGKREIFTWVAQRITEGACVTDGGALDQVVRRNRWFHGSRLQRG